MIRQDARLAKYSKFGFLVKKTSASNSLLYDSVDKISKIYI